jgi:hypothetical protein
MIEVGLCVAMISKKCRKRMNGGMDGGCEGNRAGTDVLIIATTNLLRESYMLRVRKGYGVEKLFKRLAPVAIAIFCNM